MKTKKNPRWIFPAILGLVAIFCLGYGLGLKHNRVVLEHFTRPSNPVHEDGFCYRYSIPAYPLLGVIKLELYENDSRLEPIGMSRSSEIFTTGKGMFATENHGLLNRYVYFAASDNSDPITNGRTYRLGYKFIDLTRGRLVALAVLFGLASLTIFVEFFRPAFWKAIFQTLKSELIRHREVYLFGLVVLTSVCFHVVILLGSSLLQDADTFSYFSGAVSFARDLNFNGTNGSRGPGLAMIFGPIFWIFGSHSTWPTWIVLHLFGVGAVIFTYLLARKLTNSLGVAFVTGMMAALWPDLVYYGNALLSEAPACFSLLAFSYFTVAYLLDRKFPQLLAASVFLALTILIRTEYILLVPIFLPAIGYSLWKHRDRKQALLKSPEMGQALLCVLIFSVPVFWWAWHNYSLRGFFGLTNYAYIEYYEGTVNATHLHGQNPPLVNPDSPAVQTIQTALSAEFKNMKVHYQYMPDDYPLTGMNAYYDSWALEQYYGWTSKEIAPVFKQAVFDTVKASPLQFVQLLFLKLNDGLKVDRYIVVDFIPMKPDLAGYFADHIDRTDTVPLFKKIRKFVYEDMTHTKLAELIHAWRWFGTLALVYLLFKKPHTPWRFISAIAAISIVFSLMVGLGIQRNTVPGTFLIYISAVTACIDGGGVASSRLVRRQV